MENGGELRGGGRLVGGNCSFLCLGVLDGSAYDRAGVYYISRCSLSAYVGPPLDVSAL